MTQLNTLRHVQLHRGQLSVRPVVVDLGHAADLRVHPWLRVSENAERDVAVSVSKGKFSISSGSFKLVAKDGTAYDTTFMSDVQSLSGNDLTPGQKTSGTIVFDAANGAQTGGKIALKDILADGDAGYWTL